MASEICDKILDYLSSFYVGDSRLLAKQFDVDHQKIIGALKSLQSLGNIVSVEQQSAIKIELSSEGLDIVQNGSHEAVVFNAIPPQGISEDDLSAVVGSKLKIGVSKACQNRWISIQKQGNKKFYTKSMEGDVNDEVQKDLRRFASGTGNVEKTKLDEYKKRKLLVSNTLTYYIVKKGPAFTTSVTKQQTDLTAEMLANGSWKNLSFKPYNFDALGVNISRGHLHPLLKVRSEFRTILTEMGFSEMPTNRFVESSFWNFDSLFVPQKHPARDAQDTFFLSRPKCCNDFPEEYAKEVEKVHSIGGYGSQGYGYDWKLEESRKNVMRTHTTAVSARLLYELGQAKEFKPAKLFSIDRVFRNETLDATHLAEFHQVEGVIAEKGISLAHLIGIMREFFSRLGITDLRFKPAYNPYTEPSMEVFAFHKGLKKWVEVGNSGMFRPEMVLPMGIPEDVRIIAWGLSLERPTMIKYGIDNIRDLVGPKVDLQMVYNNPLCRLEKN